MRDIRRYGSAALDLCAAAAGRGAAAADLGLRRGEHAPGALGAAAAGQGVPGLPGHPVGEPMAIASAASVAGPFVDLIAELHPTG